MVLNCDSYVSLEDCYDNYLETAWAQFNNDLQNFYAECGPSNTCNYNNLVPAYRTLINKIDELLKIMSQSVQTPEVSSGIVTFLNLKNEINNKIKKIKQGEELKIDVPSSYETKYGNTMNIRLLWIVIIVFLLLAIPSLIYINMNNRQ